MSNNIVNIDIDTDIETTKRWVEAMSESDIDKEIQACMSKKSELLNSESTPLAIKNTKLLTEVVDELNKIKQLSIGYERRSFIALGAALLTQAFIVLAGASWMLFEWLWSLSETIISDDTAMTLYTTYYQDIPVAAIAFTIIYFIGARFATGLICKAMVEKSIEKLVMLRFMISDGQ